MNNGLSSVGQFQPTSQFGPGAQQSQDQGNWLTHLLPTLGSIGATLLAPETGGLSLLAAPALGAVGSAVGQGAENLFEGKNVTNNLGQSALEGAGGGLLGSLAGNVLNKGIGAIGGMAKRGVAAQEVATQGANDIAQQQALRDAWMGVKPGLRSSQDLAGNANLVSKFGGDSTNPQHFLDTSAPAMEALGNVRDAALANSGPVDMTGFNDLVHNALSNPDTANVLGAYKTARNALTTNPSAKIYSSLQNAGAGIGGLAEADPNAVRELVSRVQSMAADAKPTINAQGVIDPTQKAIYGTYNDIANNLKGALYNRPAVDKAFSDLKGNLQPGDVGGNPALAGHLNDILDNASSAQDVLSPMAQFIKMRNLGNAGLTANQDVASAAAVRQVKAANGVSSSKIATDVPGMNTAPSSSLFGISPGMQATLGLAGMPFTGGLSAIAAAPEAMKLLGKIPPQAIQGVTGLASKAAPLLSSVGANTITHAPDLAGGSTGAPMDMSTPPQSQSNASVSPIQGLATVAAMRAAMNGDMSGIGQLQQILAPPKATAATNASNALQGLVGSFQQAGGGQGGIGGGISQLVSGVTGGPVKGYNDQKASVAAQIAGALGEDPGAVMARLPSITDSQDTAAMKIKNLMSLIQSHYQTATQTGYSTSGTGGMPMGLSAVGSGM